jgi:hypothetical protein
MLLTTGTGFTTTLTVCGFPTHPVPVAVGVTVYTTVCGVVVVLVNVLVKVLVDCMVVLSPVTLALVAAIHVKVEGISEVKGILTAPPLQMAAALVLVITGFGLTVTVTELLPEQVYKGLV